MVRGSLVFIVEALHARRISAKVMRVREYIEAILDRNYEALVVVVGDLNDEPTVDYFELNYLNNNLIAMVAGSPFSSAMDASSRLIINS